MRKAMVSLAVMLLASPGWALLIDARVDATPGGATPDGAIGANEYGPANAYSYAGGGGGFGGTVGAGTMYMNSDAGNLYLGFQPGNNLNDDVVIWLDTRSSGYFDNDMNDTADPGRNLSSNATRDVEDQFPMGADFSIVIGSFGIVVFELNAGNTPGHLEFKQFDGTFTGNNPALAREITIPFGNLDLSGGTNVINFWTGYGSDTNFMSNESIPGQPFNAGANPGFDNGNQPLGWPNWDEFVTVPEPTTIGLLAVGAVALLARRRAR